MTIAWQAFTSHGILVLFLSFSSISLPHFKGKSWCLRLNRAFCFSATKLRPSEDGLWKHSALCCTAKRLKDITSIWPCPYFLKGVADHTIFFHGTYYFLFAKVIFCSWYYIVMIKYLSYYWYLGIYVDMCGSNEGCMGRGVKYLV